MLVIIDYGVGNLNSILNLCNRLKAPALISGKSSDIANASQLILPGVGNFSEGIKNLQRSDLIGVLERRVRSEGIPLLGLCLGMQLLAKRSEEGNVEGLGWLESEVIRFRFDGTDRRLRIPHVGFNTIAMKQNPLFKYLDPNSRFYFTHSYHMVCEKEENVIATADYGYPFASVVQQGCIFGTQFHPEKSHTFGINLLRGFLEIA